MTPERWQQVEELFHSALAQERGHRAAFLAQVCDGDEPLLREVESLISFHDRPDNFIEKPASDLAAELIARRANELEAGQQIAHYKVLSSIGAGGMGEVYLAEDAKLGRRIALKLLPAQYTTDTERVRRFEQEARAASALNHPNIVTIHEIGQEELTHFIATEFIDGETLRAHIAGGAVNLDETLEIAAQIASALEAAHAAGIVHRDVKPENVMVRPDGIVKVLDFGLAKLALPQPSALDAEAQARSMINTNPGIVMGTVQYMSPEQARGHEVDARTDIWSLGVMLYEMVTGCAPFRGETPSHVIVSILENDPPPLTGNSEALGELDRIVTKALRKNIDERYQTASELAVDLKSLKQELEVEARLKRSVQPAGDGRKRATTISSHSVVETLNVSAEPTGYVAKMPTISSEHSVSGIKRHRRVARLAAASVVVVAAITYFVYTTGRGESIDSIAVLPFVNASADPNTEYLSDGISDSVIDSLSRLPNLKVKSLNWVLRYKGQQVDAQAVGRELNVKAVLMGRLTEQGDNLAISTELVNVKDNSHLWGNQYSRKVSDILGIPGEIARQISDGLGLRLSGAEKKQLTKQYTENNDAYQLYIRGRYLFNKNTRAGYEKSIEYYKQAIEKDPNYALAYAGLAYSYYFMGNRGFWTGNESGQKLQGAALKALEIDDTLAEGHALLGVNKYNNFDWAGAEKELKQALQLDPNSDTANRAYFQYLSAVGRPDEALSYAKRVVELDPTTTPGYFAYAHYLARQYDKAIELYREAQELKPNDAQHHILLGATYVATGMYKEAVAEMQKGVALDNIAERWDRHPMLAYAYAMAGNRDEALKILEEQKTLARHGYISPYNFAIIYTGLGDKDRAFEWLEKGYEERTQYVYRVKREPMFDSLRSDPRYVELLGKMNLAP